MEEGFLLDGVNVSGTWEFVNESAKNPIPVLPYSAEPSFINGNNTVVSAEITMDFTIGAFLVKRRFFHAHPLKSNNQITISNNQKRNLGCF